MEVVMDRQGWVCIRLRDLGYAKERHIRLYGKDLHLMSNPFVDKGGYSVEVIERESGTVWRMGIPLMVVSVVEEEAAMHEDLFAA
jgi:hypothetical protein